MALDWFVAEIIAIVDARYSAHGRDLRVRREPWQGMIRQWRSD